MKHKRDTEEYKRVIGRIDGYQLVKLSENNDKEHWLDVDFDDLIDGFKEEVGEVLEAIGRDRPYRLHRDAEDTFRELADLKNYCDMLADRILEDTFGKT